MIKEEETNTNEENQEMQRMTNQRVLNFLQEKVL